MKCYQALFSKNGLKANIGSYILFSIIFIYLILYNLFFLIEYDHIMNKINKIIVIKINRNKKNKEKKFIKNTINEITTNIIKKNKNKKKSKNQKKPYNKNAPIKKVKKSKGKNISTSSRLGLSSGVGESIINSNNINLGDINKKNTKEINNINNMIILFNDSEFNSMKFEEALKYDKRTFIKYYISLLRTKHLLLFAFMPSNDYNSGLLKKCISLFSFSLYYTINGLFFTNSTIHEIYEEKGKYDFIYQLPGTIYSTIISSFINAIIRFLSLSEKAVIKFKNEENDNEIFLNNEKIKLMKILRIKFVRFFNFSLSLLILFWYYISCFCAIYKNTQIHLLKDTFITFGLSLLYPIFIYIIVGFIRIYFLKNKKKFLYNLSKVIQLI